MDTTFTFRKTESTDALKSHAKAKLSKLDKYFTKPVNAHIIFNVEGFRHSVEIEFSLNGTRYFSKNESNDMYTSIDEVISKIEHQLRKNKERLKDHKG